MFTIRFHPKVLYVLMLVAFAAIPVVSQASTVRLLTALGPIDITLYDTEAPLTVANFLNYVNSGAYNNSFIHRSVPGFIIQGGGYTWDSGKNEAIVIHASAPVQNEFSASRSNVRGTIAMAKVGNDPNSATSQWFINLADNSSNLNNQNGGFTVFGQVSTSGMQVTDKIAALSTANAGGAFTNLPITSKPTSGSLGQGNLVMVMSTSSNQIGAISFSPTTLTIGGTTKVSATASSGLSVNFSSTTPSICTVSGSTVTGLAAGTCTIAADQTGNDNYNAATQVKQSFTIGMASQTPISDDRVFAYAAANYPTLFSGNVIAGHYQQYDYRYYSATRNYLAVDTSGMIYIKGSVTGDAIQSVGAVSSFTPTIVAWEAAQVQKFSLATVTDPLVKQQWGLLNTGQNGYSDTFGVANTNGTLGTDINVNPVYMNYGYTGRGVIVAVVDSGLEIAHEDLAANVVPGGSWNFVNNTTDPTSTSTTGDHGTEVSGLIAMAMNGIGGIGVAPNAKLKGFNLLASTQSVNEEIAALGGSVANPNSSDVAVFNQSYGIDATVDTLVSSTVEAQYAYGVSTLRGGKGALYVKSAGNGWDGFGTADCTKAIAIGISCQNVNFDPESTLPYNIVIAALDADGTASTYSSAGSAIWMSAPGGEMGYNAAAYTSAGYLAPAVGSLKYRPAMITTDQSGCAAGASVNTQPTATGPFSFFNMGGANVGGINANCNYTNDMNGTSSAAPMMSGSIALILEANPSLTWREVKDILAKTAVQVDTANPGVIVALSNGDYAAELPWITNAAGRKFHNWYGFGAVNASAAVDMAITYVSGSLGTFSNTGWIPGTLPANATVPDSSIVGVSVPLIVPKVGASGIVEAVQIQVTTSATKAVASTSGCITATDGCSGDLGIELTSPSGTKSILKNIRDGFNGFFLSGMVLESNAFYGESSTGNWTVKVVDGSVGSGNQTLTNVQIRVYGH